MINVNAQENKVHDALLSFMAPLSSFLENANVRDICFNPNGTLWIDDGGNFQQADSAHFTPLWVDAFLQLAARYNHATVSRQTPSLQGVLPNGARLQACFCPITTQAAFVIRAHHPVPKTLASFAEEGAFSDEIKHEEINTTRRLRDQTNNDTLSRLKTAVVAQKTILVAGGTGSGKTTLLNALISEVPLNERLIFLEDTPELSAPHLNCLPLLVCNQRDITMQSLLKIALRCRPDRLLMGEIRGGEGFDFIQSIQTGHAGAMATIHAGSVEEAFQRLVHCYQQGAMHPDASATVLADIKRHIDMVVVLQKIGGTRRCVDFYEKKDII